MSNGLLLSGNFTEEWREGEERECKLVFIGKDLNKVRVWQQRGVSELLSHAVSLSLSLFLGRIYMHSPCRIAFLSIYRPHSKPVSRNVSLRKKTAQSELNSCAFRPERYVSNPILLMDKYGKTLWSSFSIHMPLLYKTACFMSNERRMDAGSSDRSFRQ